MKGLRIREAREAKGMSQKMLSIKLGKSQTTISGWENEAKKPGIETIEKLADIFGVTTDYLLGRTEAPITLHTTNTPYMQVTPFEKDIVEKYRESSRDMQKGVCRLLQLTHPDDRLKETKQA